ncbi:hypothetical protein ACHAWF_010256 [Thalassiosira exigua]
MTTMPAPSFEPPSPDDPDRELWILRAPAHLDVSALLDGATLDLDPRLLLPPSSSSSSGPTAAGGVLSAFRSEGRGYALTLSGIGIDSDPLRLLSPDDETPRDGKLAPLARPFLRRVALTVAATPPPSGGRDAGEGEESSDVVVVRPELLVAPSAEDAPEPALDGSGNGSVDAMRRAYASVPQRKGLKRRWNMPGSRAGGTAPSSVPSASKKARGKGGKGGDVVSDEEPSEKGEDGPKGGGEEEIKSAKKKDKKEKKKKEKKSKKSPKK